MVKLSIIVPVYNAEKYLAECIESILRQSYQDMEIILVDDGSSDGSAGICDRYQDSDSRIQVIHQRNRGCIGARLSGLWKSRGAYIGFVDSDDRIAPDMYQKLMSVAEEKGCDIVTMGYTKVDGEGEEEADDATLSGLYEKGRNLDSFLSGMMYDFREGRRGCHPALWSKVIKRELLLGAYEGIDGRITMGEDAAVFYPCCLRAESIFVLKEYGYFYRIHAESMCRTMDEAYVAGLSYFYQYMRNVLSENQEKYSLYSQLTKYLWTLMVPWLWKAFRIRVTAWPFPYSIVERGEDIVLYGAGEVGCAYYRQIMENRYCSIVAWADRKEDSGKGTVRPEELLNLKYSRIVIAIADEGIAGRIREELTAMGIEGERILWAKPQEVPLSIF